MSSEQDDKHSTKEVFYDGDCPMCRAFTARVEPNADATFTDFRTSELPEPISREAAEGAIHLIDEQGNVHKGASAVLLLLENRSLIGPLAKLFRHPPLIWIAEALYPWFSRNRFVMFGPAARLFWCKIVVVLSFLIPMPITRRLFFGEHARIYPLIPVWEGLPVIPFPLDYLVFGTMLLLLAAMLLKPDPRKLIAVFLPLSFCYSLFDQSRWMPYYVEYWWMLLILLMYPWDRTEDKTQLAEKDRQQRNTLGIILLGIWFWSGIHKVSAKYLFVGYPWMVEPFVGNAGETLRTLVHAGAFLSPVVETGGALCLLFPKTRTIGIWLITAMHLVILLIFGPFGLNWNPSVWSWNVSHILLLWLIFRDDAEQGPLALIVNRGILHAATLLFFCILPVLNMFGKWDDFMSHALYSWTTQEAEIELHSPEVKEQLPAEIKAAVRTLEGREIVHILQWSFSIFESPPYHADRVFKKIFAKVCSSVERSEDLELILFGKPDWRTGVSPRRSLRCSDL